jgi:integrase/recombinase XerD
MIRLMHDFLEHGKRQHLAAKTLKDYRVFLRAFFGFLLEAYPDITEITDVTRPVVTAYEKHLLTRKDGRGKVMGRMRRKRYLCGLRLFFLYLQREEKIFKDPTTNMALPRERKRIIKDVLTPEEMEKLLKICVGETVKGLRDRAMLELLYSTGMRADELCHLETRDLDYDELVVMVRKGKCGTERVIPFGKTARYWTLRYLKQGRPLIATGARDLVFTTMGGRPLTPVTLCRIVKEYAKKAGIEKNVTTHTFRHTCATHLLKGRADIRYVQKQLGHRSIQTTEKYLKIEITDLKEVHERCHPREQEEW